MYWRPCQSLGRVTIMTSDVGPTVGITGSKFVKTVLLSSGYYVVEKMLASSS